MSQFQSLIAVSPLGLMYGSAGGFLSPDNLVGRSNQKFPPDTATMAGLIFNANREQRAAGEAVISHKELKDTLVVAGPFWAEWEYPHNFYVPIPWHRIITNMDSKRRESDEWTLVNKHTKEWEFDSEDDWQLNQRCWDRDSEKKDLKPSYFWQPIDDWDRDVEDMCDRCAEPPWKPLPFLHPKLELDQRHVVNESGLFLENAIQFQSDYCLVYLTNLTLDQLLPKGWYRLGGEGHMVEIETHALDKDHIVNALLIQPIGHACALITPGVWGSNNYSYRYPHHSDFPKKDLKMLTDKPIPYRYRIGQSHDQKDQKEQKEQKQDPTYDPSKTGRLSRGRYAVPPGSVYVFREPLNRTWWEFPDDWFPKEGFRLRHLGCGLCLPINIKGVPKIS